LSADSETRRARGVVNRSLNFRDRHLAHLLSHPALAYLDLQSSRHPALSHTTEAHQIAVKSIPRGLTFSQMHRCNSAREVEEE